MNFPVNILDSLWECGMTFSEMDDFGIAMDLSSFVQSLPAAQAVHKDEEFAAIRSLQRPGGQAWQASYQISWDDQTLGIDWLD